MKIAILLAISLIFVSCGRKKGPNTRPGNGNAASSTKASGASSNTKADLECSAFSDDNTNIASKQVLTIDNGQYKYSVSVSPIIYSIESLKLTKACLNNSNDWKEIAITDDGLNAASDENLNKVCAELLTNTDIEKTHISVKQVISEVSEATSFHAGFVINIQTSNNPANANQAYFCNHELIKKKK